MKSQSTSLSLSTYNLFIADIFSLTFSFSSLSFIRINDFLFSSTLIDSNSCISFVKLSWFSILTSSMMTSMISRLLFCSVCSFLSTLFLMTRWMMKISKNWLMQKMQQKTCCFTLLFHHKSTQMMHEISFLSTLFLMTWWMMKISKNWLMQKTWQKTCYFMLLFHHRSTQMTCKIMMRLSLMLLHLRKIIMIFMIKSLQNVMMTWSRAFWLILSW